MINKFLSRFSAGHGFFCHKEQEQFEIEIATRHEKIMARTFFSF